MKNLNNIVRDFLDGRLTEEEFTALTRDFSTREIKKAVQECTEVDYFVSLKYQSLDTDAAFAAFLSKIKAKESLKPRIFGLERTLFFRYAAIFAGIIGIGLLLMTGSLNNNSNKIKVKNEAITLQTFNNRSQRITSDSNTQFRDDQGKVIAVQKGNKIIYDPDIRSTELIYNVLHVPYGKTFELQLSDGTEVHLNSGSSIKYPIHFTGKGNRAVFLTGEAYFHVAHDREHPFIVHASELNIRVLGTRFDVSSYKEDDYINTVLVSGSVELFNNPSDGSTVNSIKLSPGKIAKWNHVSEGYHVGPVDTALYTAWMQGKLVFKDEAFKSIREKLERHYNVSIVNHNESLDENTFNAEFDTESIEEVMEIFDRNFGINYKIRDNKIIIY